MSAAIEVKVFDTESSSSLDGILRMSLLFERTEITLKHLITERVEKEVAEFNNRREHKFYNGLVQPLESELVLNGYKMKKQDKIDAARQVEKALELFEKNAYFVIVNDKQVESLDSTIIIGAESKAEFFKLMPLQGG